MLVRSNEQVKIWEVNRLTLQLKNSIVLTR